MKCLVILALLFGCACAVRLSENEYRNEFTNWMQLQQKSYKHDEFQFRYRVFRNNLNYIRDFNARNDNFTLKMNQFGDLTNAEFRQVFLGFKMPASGKLDGPTFQPEAVKLPTSWDWKAKGAVTPVKNQGQCGSCWSFSTTGSVEGCHFIGTQALVSLSEQNLMDCSWSQGDQGCDGGLMTDAMDYIISNSGVDTESSYPYTAESSNTCQYSATNKGSTLGSYANVAQGDETALQNSVYAGPTSVAIDASQSSFQFYSGGVYYEPDCSSTQLDHGVLAIGWGTDTTGGDYWTVKNSWGTDWGMKGYIWMARNKSNNCGIATMATLPKTCGN